MPKKYVEAGSCLLFKPNDGAPLWIARENSRFNVTLPDGTRLEASITIGKGTEKSDGRPSLKMQWILPDTGGANSDSEWMGDNGSATSGGDDLL